MSVPVRILVVDDDDNLRQTLSMLLEHAGYLVTASSSAQESLCCLENETFDLVFLDMAVPDLDQFHLLPRMRQRYPHVPVMLLTGHSLADGGLDPAHCGISGYLSKPVDPENILAHVSHLTSRTHNPRAKCGAVPH